MRLGFKANNPGVLYWVKRLVFRLHLADCFTAVVEADDA